MLSSLFRWSFRHHSPSTLLCSLTGKYIRRRNDHRQTAVGNDNVCTVVQNILSNGGADRPRVPPRKTVARLAAACLQTRPDSRAFSEYREIWISGYDFDLSDIQISEYEGIEYENVIYVCLTVLVYM